jgi:probable HAF family extracellular repeat protein
MGGLISRGVRWESGVATSLGDIAPTGVNASGAVVGYLSTNLAGFGWVDHAALWQAGAIVDLGTLGGHWSYATSIADSGRVVGMSFLANDINRRATLWQSGVPRDLGTLGGQNSYAYDVNAAGLVVGVAETAAGQPHAFRFTLDAAGNVALRTDLGALLGGFSCAYSINDAGVIVGSSDGEAFVYQNGAMQALTTLVPPEKNWRLDIARAVNNRGQIVGAGLHYGQPRAFLATPAIPGDLNCDGVVDFFDIDPLVIALGGQPAYDAAVPDCRWLNADCDSDGDVDFFDIDPFVALLGG